MHLFMFPPVGDSHGELDNFEIQWSTVGKYVVSKIPWRDNQNIVIQFNENFQMKCLIFPPLCLGVLSNSRGRDIFAV